MISYSLCNKFLKLDWGERILTSVGEPEPEAGPFLEGAGPKAG